MSNNTNPISIPFEANRRGDLKTEHVLAIAGTRFRLGIFVVAEGDEARKDFGGPMVPGPWAGTFGLATCMAANPAHGTGAEIARNKEAGIEHTVKTGDELEIDGNVYTIEVYRREYIALKLVRAAS